MTSTSSPASGTPGGPIARGADGAGLARRLYRRSPLRWLHNVWWDHRGLRPNDVMMCSYPRSGSTWLRFLMYAVTVGDDGTFTSVGRYMPYVGRHSDASPSLAGGGRLIKTHEPYNDYYRRVIHLVRDPRDVCVSYWTFMQRIGKLTVKPGDDDVASFDHFVSAFVAGKVDGFSTWNKHLASYLEAAQERPSDFLRIRFEDMRADTAGNLLDIAAFLGLELTREHAQRAAESGSLENMRRAEEEAIATEPSAFADATRRSGIRAIQSGSVGGWRNRLTEDQARRFDVFAPEMQRVGYSID